MNGLDFAIIFLLAGIALWSIISEEETEKEKSRQHYTND